MKKKDRNLDMPQNGEELEKSVEEEVCPDSEGKETCLDEWREALETAVCQRDEYLDCLRRTQADFQNFRRRNQAARADGYEDGAREVISEMIPVLDNLERAVKAAAAAEEGPLLEGVKMTFSQLSEAMRKFGLEELPAEGRAFDPELHHAVLKEPTDDPGKVIEVLQKGYRVKDRIVRYAMVKVSVEE
ncbi:MAG: nucleotide exchange factor GrpE [Clostridiales bacterium]|nr:nucleotide exchange factor GrpE [Clostridiales bacterium]